MASPVDKYAPPPKAPRLGGESPICPALLSVARPQVQLFGLGLGYIGPAAAFPAPVPARQVFPGVFPVINSSSQGLGLGEVTAPTPTPDLDPLPVYAPCPAAPRPGHFAGPQGWLWGN